MCTMCLLRGSILGEGRAERERAARHCAIALVSPYRSAGGYKNRILRSNPTYWTDPFIPVRRLGLQIVNIRPKIVRSATICPRSELPPVRNSRQHSFTCPYGFPIGLHYTINYCSLNKRRFPLSRRSV